MPNVSESIATLTEEIANIDQKMEFLTNLQTTLQRDLNDLQRRPDAARLYEERAKLEKLEGVNQLKMKPIYKPKLTPKAAWEGWWTKKQANTMVKRGNTHIDEFCATAARDETFWEGFSKRHRLGFSSFVQLKGFSKIPDPDAPGKFNVVVKAICFSDFPIIDTGKWYFRAWDCQWDLPVDKPIYCQSARERQ